MTPRSIPIGHGFLLVMTEDFLNGFQADHLAYMAEGRTVQFTEERLIALIMEKLESLEYSEPYSVGYVVAWIATLAEKGMKQQKDEQGSEKEKERVHP
jgi:hypothetical protein